MSSELSTGLADQLRDIHGLDPVPWWPLAPGWWLLAVLMVLLALLLVMLVKNLRHYPPGSWRRDAWVRLRRLKNRSSTMPVEQLAGELSELLRRIAVARHGRDQAAGLAGEQWLRWLQEHDPGGFDWVRRGGLLLTLPYAPPGLHQQERKQLLPLIRAAEAWTRNYRGARHA